MIKHYAQGHKQAATSFYLSMIFAIVGFGIIAVALVQFLQQPQQSIPAGITGSVGVINEVLGVLFFRRADKARQLMMQLIDKLQAEFRDKGLDRVNISDETNPLAAALSVTSFPTTVLIDREGKVASYVAGVRGEAGLRGDLEKLGLK